MLLPHRRQAPQRVIAVCLSPRVHPASPETGNLHGDRERLCRLSFGPPVASAGTPGSDLYIINEQQGFFMFDVVEGFLQYFDASREMRFYGNPLQRALVGLGQYLSTLQTPAGLSDTLLEQFLQICTCDRCTFPAEQIFPCHVLGLQAAHLTLEGLLHRSNLPVLLHTKVQIID